MTTPSAGVRSGSVTRTGHRVLMGEQTELDERPRVEEEIDPLARGQLVPGVLLGNALRATHRQASVHGGQRAPR